MRHQASETMCATPLRAARGLPVAQARRRSACCTGIALAVAFLLIIQTATVAQPSGSQSTTCLGQSESVSLSLAPVVSQVFFEVELTLLNKTTGKVHMDPGQIALISDQGDQANPLTAEQAKSIIFNPGQSLWAGFWFGLLGYAANQAKQADLMKQVDAKILTAADIQPGATQKGSLFFKLPNPKADQFILVMDGLSAESTTLAPFRVSCEFPKNRPSQNAPAPPAVRTYALALRAASGPIALNLSKIAFAKDATVVEVAIENSSDTDANLFFAKIGAILTDTNGKSYALRSLKTEINDRVAAHGSVRGTLVFEPLPQPPLTSAVMLTIPDIRVADDVYEVKVMVRL